MAHELSCSAACGIFPDQGSNPCPLHWQADSQPLRHEGSPGKDLYRLLEEVAELINPTSVPHGKGEELELAVCLF